MQKPHISRRGFISVISAAALAKPSFAQSAFPNKPVKIIVPWPAGGGGDTVVRLLVPGLTKRLGQPVVVENRPGAGGAIGHAATAKSTADGYTLVYSSADTHALVSLLYKEPQFDAKKDFVAVASLGMYPLGLVVNASLPIRNLAQFVQYAKQSGAPLAYGSHGLGSSPHIVMEAFGKAAKVDLLHVPFQGAAPMMTAVLGNQIPAGSTHIASLDQHIRGGRVRLIAVTTKERLPSFPDVPTFKEQGYPIEDGSWAGLLAPAGVPPDILAKLHQAIEDTVAEPSVADQYKSLSTVLEKMSQPQFNKYILSEYDRWAVYIKETNISL